MAPLLGLFMPSAAGPPSPFPTVMAARRRRSSAAASVRGKGVAWEDSASLSAWCPPLSKPSAASARTAFAHLDGVTLVGAGAAALSGCAGFLAEAFADATP